MLEVFNTLLRHLRISVDKDVGGPKSADEKNFQEAIINTIGMCVTGEGGSKVNDEVFSQREI